MPTLLRYSDAAIGWRLRQARLRAGLKQRDVAEAVGVSTRRIAAFEQGSAPISSAMLQRLFHVVHDRFVCVHGAERDAGAGATSLSGSEQSRSLKQLSDEQRDDLLTRLEKKISGP